MQEAGSIITTFANWGFKSAKDKIWRIEGLKALRTKLILAFPEYNFVILKDSKKHTDGLSLIGQILAAAVL